jgi:hypothetical protein
MSTKKDTNPAPRWLQVACGWFFDITVFALWGLAVILVAAGLAEKHADGRGWAAAFMALVWTIVTVIAWVLKPRKESPDHG